MMHSVEHHSSKENDYQVQGNTVEIRNVDKTKQHLADIARDGSFEELKFQFVPQLTKLQMVEFATTMVAIEQSYETSKRQRETEAVRLKGNGVTSKKLGDGVAAVQEDMATIKAGVGSVEDGVATVATIKRMVEETKCLRRLQASPEFFNALSDFSDQYPAVCSTITTIEVTLDSAYDTKQSFFAHAVLSEVILIADLRHLALQQFRPGNLLAALATLELQKKVESVSLEFNSLTTGNLLLVLRCLPKNVKMKLNVANNLIDNEEKIARHISRYENLESVTILSQLNQKLNGDKLQEEVTACEGWLPVIL